MRAIGGNCTVRLLRRGMGDGAGGEPDGSLSISTLLRHQSLYVVVDANLAAVSASVREEFRPQSVEFANQCSNSFDC